MIYIYLKLLIIDWLINKIYSKFVEFYLKFNTKTALNTILYCIFSNYKKNIRISFIKKIPNSLKKALPFGNPLIIL